MLLLFLGLIVVVFGGDVHQYDMMPEDNPKFNSSNLGICFGSNTNWNSYPYMAALRYSSGSACCSGSIVSLNPGIILTAAHCNGCTGAIRIGCSNPASCTGGSYPIAQFVQNPGYGSPLTFSGDIAVVRTTSPITQNGAQAIPYPQVEASGGSPRLTGYGITQSGSIPTSLQTMTSTIIARQTCSDIMSAALGGGSYVDSTMMCIRAGGAGQENVPTMCSGDSGGPMVVSNQVYGVNSWVLQGSGGGCNSCNCCPGYPQVGANVALYYSWINGYVGEWTKKYKVENFTATA